uniref:Uncharacterized protein n=1 Tax=Aegilops tauschii subsp. strangulata TaxID=200361 RepID=A0A452YVG1_AEGTS
FLSHRAAHPTHARQRAGARGPPPPHRASLYDRFPTSSSSVPHLHHHHQTLAADDHVLLLVAQAGRRPLLPGAAP